MGRNSKISKEIKTKVCKDYKNGIGDFQSISNALGVYMDMVREWYGRFIKHGEDVFNQNKTNKSYTSAFKENIVKEYKSGCISYRKLSYKHNMASSLVKEWIIVVLN